MATYSMRRPYTVVIPDNNTQKLIFNFTFISGGGNYVVALSMEEAVEKIKKEYGHLHPDYCNIWTS